MKPLIYFLLCLITLTTCDTSSPNPEFKEYLPLQIGNSWKLVPTGNNPQNYYSFKRVTDKVILDGHSYYAVVSGYANPEEAISDTLYYRIDPKGFVYTRRKTSTFEENVFRLRGVDGDAWSYQYDNYTTNISMSVIKLSIADEELKNCKAYYRDVDLMADEESTTTLAKGIGFVKIYSDAWSNGSILKSAVIDGREIDF